MSERLYAPDGLTPNFNLLNPSPTAPKIIGLAGYAQSGKDSVGQIIHRLYSHTVLSFSDILREFLFAQDLHLSDGKRLNPLVNAYGWEEVRRMYDPEIRLLQQHTGHEAGRLVLGGSVWVDAWINRVDTFGGSWVNPSVRYPNEVEAIHRLGGTMIRVIRPGVGAVNSHASDSALDDMTMDLRIVNDGDLVDLEGEVQRVLGEFK